MGPYLLFIFYSFIHIQIIYTTIVYYVGTFFYHNTEINNIVAMVCNNYVGHN